MAENNFIVIEGASENNLKNIDLKIPKNKITIITGVSGSGKSSLAFDTIYAEGYRRYMENFSPGANFFLSSMKKPKVKKIDNLPPTIAISQKINVNNPRSTVGTITGIYDLFRIIFAGYGEPYCQKCGNKMFGNNISKTIDYLKNERRGTQIVVLALWEKGTGVYEKINAIKNFGYAKARINGKIIGTKEAMKIAWRENERVEVVIDRMILNGIDFDKERLVDSFQSALKISTLFSKLLIDGEKEISVSQKFVCPKGCGNLEKFSYKDLSFNNPHGACEKCEGLGQVFVADPAKIIPSKKISIAEGAILPWNKIGTANKNNLNYCFLQALAKKYDFSLSSPISKIGKDNLKRIIYGDEGRLAVKVEGKMKELEFRGVAKILEEKYRKAEADFLKNEMRKFMIFKKCEECSGARLKREFLSLNFFGKSLGEIVLMEIVDLIDFLKKVSTENKRKKFPSGTVDEIIKRLFALEEIGLGYLDINRSCQTLSGGEFQRIRLANQLSSGLGGVVYVLDEPSIGLHSKDNHRLIRAMEELKNKGNTLIVVEHDREIIRKADFVIDIGPGAGQCGGEVVFQGEKKEINKAQSETGSYLRKKGLIYEELISNQKKRKKDSGLFIEGAEHNNLKNIDVEFPLGKMLAIVGASGSGKSSLVNDILVKVIRKKLHRCFDEPGKFRKIKGVENLSKIVSIDQNPLGRSSRSNPATYCGAFSFIREIFADTPMAKKKRLTAGHFSFNVRGGRCEHCQGEGVKKMEMTFLDDVFSVCPECEGLRYSKKVLEVKFHGVSIADVLNMNIEYARHFFSFHSQIENKLKALCDVGLGYLRLGQNATELSGGEAQRIKLATELARSSKGNVLYVLDEPTIGLHFSDVEKLLHVLKKLIEKGHSVFIIEHNLDVVGVCDWVIELGPSGGHKGGEVVFQGLPKNLAGVKTQTGQAMKDLGLFANN